MYGLQKAFPVYTTIFIVILLSILLVTSCQGKKEKPSSVENAPQNQTEAGEILSQSPSVEGETDTKVSEQTRLPKLIDLGADKCIPCKMMAPILEELKQEYAGKLEVIFFDVWKDPKKGREYGIRVIPTQIFYDTHGNEFYRNVGFFSKEDILKTFREKGMSL